MILNTNNCLEMKQLGVQLQIKYWQQESTAALNDVLKELNDTFIVILSSFKFYRKPF